MKTQDTTALRSDSNAADISRKAFLKTAGSVALFAALGITLPGCGSEDAENIMGPEPEEPPSQDTGISISGNTITIDLTKDDTLFPRNQRGMGAHRSRTNAGCQRGRYVSGPLPVCVPTPDVTDSGIIPISYSPVPATVRVSITVVK